VGSSELTSSPCFVLCGSFGCWFILEVVVAAVGVVESFGSVLRRARKDVSAVPLFAGGSGGDGTGFVSPFDAAWVGLVEEVVSTQRLVVFGTIALVLPFSVVITAGLQASLVYIACCLLVLPFWLVAVYGSVKNFPLLLKLEEVVAGRLVVWLDEVLGESFGEEEVSRMADHVVRNAPICEGLVSVSGRRFSLKSDLVEAKSVQRKYYLVELKEELLVGRDVPSSQEAGE
jgi:hypothetical protein